MVTAIAQPSIHHNLIVIFTRYVAFFQRQKTSVHSPNAATKIYLLYRSYAGGRPLSHCDLDTPVSWFVHAIAGLN